MKLPKELQTTEMILCQGCGEFHPVTECEVVVVKIVKGKNCQLNQKSIFGTSTTGASLQNKIATETKEEFPVLDRPVVPMKKAIPPGFMSMMLPPDNPDFESKGAKETRRI
jgi:hypothetical protein